MMRFLSDLLGAARLFRVTLAMVRARRRVRRIVAEIEEPAAVKEPPAVHAARRVR